MRTTTLPDWVRHAVFYEVYPQTFFDTNGDGIGDLEGVIRKLDYIQSTGATAIWMNPFYKSPMRDAGYDVSGFCEVDPRYGSMDDARRLFSEAHARGMRVIIDFVPGHTSIDHPWFQESCKQHPERPYKNWYIWTQSAWENAGDPWSAKMVHGYASRDGNFLINFFWSQPALNFGFAKPEADKAWQLPTTHEDVQLLWKEMRAVLRFWLEAGADGFRVDMADSLIRNDPDKKEIRRFWREVREDLDPDFPEMFLIAEGHPSNVLDGSGFHSAYLHWVDGYMGVFRQGEIFNQELGKEKVSAYFDRSGEGDFRPYLKVWREQMALVAEGCVITTPVGNHDLSRFVMDQTEEEIELVFAFQCAWPGIPFFYYGDEIGMRQQSAENPIVEGCYPTRNGARTPMQWDESKNLGFSDAGAEELYLPVDPEPGARTVAAQEAREDSLLNRVRDLNKLHKSHPAFAADAAIDFLTEGAPGEPLIFVRKGDGEQVLCCFQPADKVFRFVLPENFAEMSLLAGRGELQITGKVIEGGGVGWSFWKVGS